MGKFKEWLSVREQMAGTAAAAGPSVTPNVSGVIKKAAGSSNFDKTKKRIDATLKGIFLKGNLKQAPKQVDNIINGEINNAATGLEDAAKLANMRDSIKKNLSSV
jgi:hypothetical protein